MRKQAEGLKIIKNYFKCHVTHQTSDVGLFEFGIDDRRFDLIIVTPSLRRIRIFEFKVNRSDFRQDVRSGKWKNYLKYCNTFTWVSPPGLIKKEEVEAPAGLLWVDQKQQKLFDDSQEYPFCASYYFNTEWKRRPKSTEGISRADRERLLFYLFSRIKHRKEDFL